MDTDDNLPFYLSAARGLQTATAKDDFLHPEANRSVTQDSLTETQYFGICVPEELIHGVLYCWHHPNLKVVSGGVWVWQGMKATAVECEMYDWQCFMSDRVLSDDLHSFRLDNGYGVRVVDPIKKHHVTYSDPSRGNSFDLEYEGLSPPVLWANGTHFEQAMRVRGDLKLRGKSYKIDGFNLRDRSWAKPRPESHLLVPPANWMTCVFNENFYWMCTASDHPDLDPDWGALYPDFSADRTLVGGWIHRDGEVTEIVECRKKTTRNRSTMNSQTIDLHLVDSKGKSYAIVGEVIAASAIPAWPNTIPQWA